jgi:chaperonin GroES
VKSNLKMLDDQILVKEVPKPDRTPGGIMLPDTAKEQLRGKIVDVLAVGPGRFIEATGTVKPMDIKEGQRIIIKTYAGHEIELDGEKFTIVGEKLDVLAVLPDSDNVSVV